MMVRIVGENFWKIGIELYENIIWFYVKCYWCDIVYLEYILLCGRMLLRDLFYFFYGIFVCINLMVLLGVLEMWDIWVKKI